MNIKYKNLFGRYSNFRLLDPDHEQGLRNAANEESTWRFMKLKGNGIFFDDWYQDLKQKEKLGLIVPYVIHDASSDSVIGAMGISNISEIDEKAEISGLWLHSASRGRRKVFYEGTYLVLKHMFEDQGINRLEIRADSRNITALNLYRNIGAVEEGVLRQNVRTQDGFIGDTAILSILKDEWSAIERTMSNVLYSRYSQN